MLRKTLSGLLRRKILWQLLFCIISLSLCIYILNEESPVVVHQINENNPFNHNDPVYTAKQLQKYRLKPLFFAITNNAFNKMAKNLILNWEKYNIMDYIVFCSDIECYNEMIKFRNNKNKIKYFTQNLNNINTSEIASMYMSFGSQLYNTMTYMIFIRRYR